MKGNCNSWYLNSMCFSKLPDHLIFVTWGKVLKQMKLKTFHSPCLKKNTTICTHEGKNLQISESKVPCSRVRNDIKHHQSIWCPLQKNCQTQLQEWVNSFSTISTFNVQLGREAEGTGVNDGVDNGHAEGRNLWRLQQHNAKLISRVFASPKSNLHLDKKPLMILASPAMYSKIPSGTWLIDWYIPRLHLRARHGH